MLISRTADPMARFTKRSGTARGEGDPTGSRALIGDPRAVLRDVIRDGTTAGGSEHQQGPGTFARANLA